MAKQLPSQETSMNDKDDTAKKAEAEVKAAEDAAKEAAEAAKAKHDEAKAAAETAPVASGFHEPGDVKVGEKHWLFNVQTHSTRCPYSGVQFPAGNFTSDKDVEVNQWIKSQVDAGLLKAKK